MGYNQGTGDLQRTKTSASVTLGSSNGAASVTCEGNRISLTVTLNGNLGSVGVGGPITLNNSVIKSTSVIESCMQSNVIFTPFDVFDVQDGSAKMSFINYSGGTLPGGASGIFSIAILN